MNLSLSALQVDFLSLCHLNCLVIAQRNMEYSALLDENKFQSLAMRRDIHSAKFLWKIVRNRVDCRDIPSMINFYVALLNNRHAVTFYLPKPKTATC